MILIVLKDPQDPEGNGVAYDYGDNETELRSALNELLRNNGDGFIVKQVVPMFPESPLPENEPHSLSARAWNETLSAEARLFASTNCLLCQRPMMHTRLYGYQCSNPTHAHILSTLLTQAGTDRERFENMLRNTRKEMGYSE